MLFRSSRPTATATSPSTAGRVLTTVRAGTLELRVVSDTGELQMGENRFTIEFHDAVSGATADAGTVQASGTMSMPGMVMNAPITLTPVRPGVYAAAGQFAMSGSWTLRLDWEGPAGRGTTTFEGQVR